MQVVSWWMLDLARAAAGDELTSPADMLATLYCWDSSNLQ